MVLKNKHNQEHKKRIEGTLQMPVQKREEFLYADLSERHRAESKY